MGKNAYEIRLDTLHLARDLLSENMQVQLTLWKETRNDGEASPPKGFNSDDVLSEANKLYAFIGKAGKDDAGKF